ncbi:hypothetical protein Pla52n_61510 [Stieleria varia]|uniref:Uncharacterized protein n=1 Tax=Stieleria varia TaxID=2528005 RepID=A0A5C6A051_9BACT|nr:hypothetical protein Pla52n_61510 [Stieleria varia]
MNLGGTLPERMKSLVQCPVLILGLAVLALATVVSRKPWLTPKRLIYRTHVLRLDDALVQCLPFRLLFLFCRVP